MNIERMNLADLKKKSPADLLAMAEDKLGPPPVPYLWLACGSQGRQEQTGVSDQDNCLIIDDAMEPGDDAYFKALARIGYSGDFTWESFSSEVVGADVTGLLALWRTPWVDGTAAARQTLAFMRAHVEAARAAAS